MTKPKYKVGDRVRIRKWEDMVAKYGVNGSFISPKGATAHCVSDYKEERYGIEGTIGSIDSDGDYTLEEVNDIFYYGEYAIEPTLKELPNVVVHCKNESEYKELMKIYEEGGWKSSGGYLPTDRPSHCWKENGHVFRWINVYDGFWGNRFSTDEYANGSESYGKEEITLQEFKRLQGLEEKSGIEKLSPELKEMARDMAYSSAGSYVKRDLASTHTIAGGTAERDINVFSGESLWRSYNLWKMFLNEDGVPAPFNPPTNLPPSNMSIVDKVRRTRLNPSERALRKAGFKDSCGNWSEDAHSVVADIVCEQNRDELVKLAKEFNKEDDS